MVFWSCRTSSRSRNSHPIPWSPASRTCASTLCVPLITPDGWAIGTLCVLDREPRTLTEQQEFILKALARTVMAQLESRRSAAALRAREAELRLVADAMPVLIGFIDRSLTYRFANAAYRTWTGRGPEEVVGRTIAEVLSTGESKARLPQIERALAAEEVRFELDWACPDGQVRVADIRYMPRFAADGAVDGFYVFVHDVSDRKRVETLLPEPGESSRGAGCLSSARSRPDLDPVAGAEGRRCARRTHRGCEPVLDPCAGLVGGGDDGTENSGLRLCRRTRHSSQR